MSDSSVICSVIQVGLVLWSLMAISTGWRNNQPIRLVDGSNERGLDD